jgi:hypothetical protein
MHLGMNKKSKTSKTFKISFFFPVQYEDIKISLKHYYGAEQSVISANRQTGLQTFFGERF